jgi:ferredoxin-type protein NapF
MSVDLQRRAFFMTGQVKELSSDIHLPYLKDIEHFLDKCTQCQACLEHCPESIIEKGQGGYPTVNFNLGECTYCQDCAKHCPENLFDVNQKEAWSLDLAINNSCFAERGIVCQSCRDACEPQAITFQYARFSIPKPEINESSCTSCGACVTSCPADAITVLASKNASVEIANKEYSNE